MKYRKLEGYKYQLAEPESIRLPHLAGLGTLVTPHIILLPSGMCMARTGYRWDGPSGPTLDDDSNMLPSLWRLCRFYLPRLSVGTWLYPRRFSGRPIVFRAWFLLRVLAARHHWHSMIWQTLPSWVYSPVFTTGRSLAHPKQ